jgi:hypothetical protein
MQPHGSRLKIKFAVSIFLIAVVSVSAIALINSIPALANTKLPIEWQKNYGQTSVESIIQTADGGYAMIGRFGSTTTSGYRGGVYWAADYYLMKLDGSGKIVWRQSYGNVLTSPVSFEQTKDGGYVISCFYKNSYKLPCIIKTNDKGTIEWYQTYQVTSLSADRNFNFLLTNDGGFLLYGYFLTNDNNQATPFNFFIKTDNRGNQLWNRTFSSEYIPYLGGYAFSAVEANDGSYAMMRNSFSWISGIKGYLWFSKTSGDGQVLSNHNVNSVPNSTDIATYLEAPFLSVTNNGYNLAGLETYYRSSDYSGNGYAYASLKFDSDGNYKEIRTYMFSEVFPYLPSVFEPLNGNGTIIASSNKDDMLIVEKTDSAGTKIWSGTYDVNIWEVHLFGTNDGGCLLAATGPDKSDRTLGTAYLIKFSSVDTAVFITPAVSNVVSYGIAGAAIVLALVLIFYYKHRKNRYKA